MLEWLIIGGGFQGTHLSLYLTKQMKIARDRVAVLDPYESPLALWNKRTANCGMQYLRSTSVHNLDINLFSLNKFAGSRRDRTEDNFLEPLKRPAYDLFQAHLTAVITKNQLSTLRHVGQACGLIRRSNGWRVETTSGQLDARRAVLAIGRTNLRWPSWATALKAGGGPVYHLFDPNFDRKVLPTWSHCVVVGGGISAAQTALALARRHPGRVTLLMRHSLRRTTLDSHPCWSTAEKCLRKFSRTTSLIKRREMIDRGRNPGTMPSEVARDLQSRIALESIRRYRAEVTDAQLIEQGNIILKLSNNQTLATDCLILATGFEAVRPGGVWLDQAIEHLGLPCAPCSYPIVDKALQWAPGLYVMGPLAELEIGPTAPNITGARMAARRIGNHC
ncbi:MAG: FAD/NAD(P)-binding protein [Chloroflexota bacterium]